MNKYVLIVLVCGLLLTGCGSTKEVSSSISNQQEDLVIAATNLYKNKQYQEALDLLSKEVWAYEITSYLKGESSDKSELILLYLISYTKLHESKNDYIQASKYINYLKPIDKIITSDEISKMKIAHAPLKDKQVQESTSKLVREIEQSLAEMKNKEVTVGMTSDEVLLSKWGSPKKINKTTTENNVSEQWVYGNGRYVYLDNGIVTTIQE